MRAHQHLHYEMIVVMRGGMNVEIDGEIRSVGVGGIILYPENVRHCEYVGQYSELESFFLGFSSQNTPEKVGLQVQDSDSRIRMLCEWLYSQRDSHYACADKWRISLVNMIQEEYLRLAEVAGDDLVDEAKRFIRSNLGESFSLDDLAANAGVSKFHFIREYEKLSGVTPMADVRKMRLHQARDYIVSTDEPLKIIAERVGFVSGNHLSRLLKECFGVGARQMRGSNGGVNLNEEDNFCAF